MIIDSLINIDNVIFRKDCGKPPSCVRGGGKGDAGKGFHFSFAFLDVKASLASLAPSPVGKLQIFTLSVVGTTLTDC